MSHVAIAYCGAFVTAVLLIMFLYSVFHREQFGTVLSACGLMFQVPVWLMYGIEAGWWG